LPAPLHPARPIILIYFSEPPTEPAIFCLQVLYIGQQVMSCQPANDDEDR
jgi:hypothetical protein